VSAISTITRMIRFGHTYRIQLSCGHTLEGTAEEIMLAQLFIGKRMKCEQCLREWEAGDDSSE